MLDIIEETNPLEKLVGVGNVIHSYRLQSDLARNRIGADLLVGSHLNVQLVTGLMRVEMPSKGRSGVSDGKGRFTLFDKGERQSFELVKSRCNVDYYKEID